MSIRAKILAGIAASLVLIICVWPGLSRCYFYHRFIAGHSTRYGNSEGKIWEVSTLDTLAQKAVKFEIKPSYAKNNFSLGYAEFYLDQNDVCEITIVNEQIVSIKCDTYFIGFLPPTEPIDLSPDNNNQSQLTPEFPPKDFYQAQVKAAYACPKTYFQIFFMSGYEFAEFMYLCMLKTMFINNQNGIGIFETDKIKGLIEFGEVQSPNKMVIDLYSADSAISQEIIVKSDSPEKTKDIILSLLSSYRYLIEKPLNESDLQQLILDKLSSHPLFHEYNPEQDQ